MIKYDLSCAAGHEFVGWFQSSAAFDRQAERRLVTCPECGSSDVEKRPMAPAVIRSRGSGQPSAPAVETPPRAAPTAEMLRAFKQKVVENTEDVGDRFAEEALRIHFGEAEQRGIRGETSLEDARRLYDEGVEFGVLPLLPEDKN